MNMVWKLGVENFEVGVSVLLSAFWIVASVSISIQF